MRHNNPRHEIRLDLLQQLPTTLLLNWHTIHFLSYLRPLLAADLPDLTIDLLLLLLQAIATEYRVDFCGFLSCRRCLRIFKDLPLNSENEALLYYITCITFRVLNHGADTCTRDIPNSKCRTSIVIASKETTTEALRRRGVPVCLPTITTPSISETKSNTPTPTSRCGKDPRQASLKRRGGSPDRMDHPQKQLGNLFHPPAALSSS